MSDDIRLLDEDDRDALDRLLAERPDETMFFRSNILRAGIVYTGADFTAQYLGLFRDGAIRAVVGHCWNGIVLLHDPDVGRPLTPSLARSAVALSRRPVTGLIGGWSSVMAVRAALGMAERATNMVSHDILFGLDLDALQVPSQLQAPGAKPENGDVGIRFRRADERDFHGLVAYRMHYHKETLGSLDNPGLVAQCQREIRTSLEDDAFVLITGSDDFLLSCSFFNARVPDTVQIGGVYTPLPLRGQGYGRMVVAGSLLIARDQGVSRSILFTGQDNPAAQAAYRALGYQPVGDYGLILFAAT